MLLIIHNLPSYVRYTDVKSLIKKKCGLTEIIVDNLVVEGEGKKVTVGLADEKDAAILLREINGLYFNNNQLYVEDMRQNKSSEQPQRPSSMQTNQVEQYSQSAQPQFGNQFYRQHGSTQYQAPQMMSEIQLNPGPSTPNFGVPFYMSAQNQNVGNNLQYMIQYPKPQGHTGNESYEGRDIGFDQQYGGEKGDRSRSPDRRSQMMRSPRPFSRWNEPDKDRLESRRGRDRPSERDNRHDADRSYRDKSYRDSFQNKSNQDYGSSKQSNNRFEKPFNRSVLKWERPARSTFGETKEPFQDRQHKETVGTERGPQRYMEDNFSQSRGSGYESRPGDFSKKRPFESQDKNNFGPKNKKKCNNQQFNLRIEPGFSGNPFSINHHNKNNTNFNKVPVRPHMHINRPQMQPKNLQTYDNKPQCQQSRPEIINQTKVSKNPPAPTLSEFPNPLSVKETIAKHEALRVQASSTIATQIWRILRIKSTKRSPLNIKLKECVRARLDVILGDDMSMSVREMITRYQEKFQDVRAFYNAVIDKFLKEGIEPKNKEPESGAIDHTNENSAKPQSAAQPPVQVFQRLPKHPERNKMAFKQMRWARQDEMVNENLYKMDAEREKALREELDKVDEMIKKELELPKNETENYVSKFMNAVFVPNLRKILNLNIKKRVMNIRTSLELKVGCSPRSPNKDILHAFMKNCGVISLHQVKYSSKMYIATCDSYKSFDALCKKEPTFIDGMKISFKPCHVLGAPENSQSRNNLRKHRGANKPKAATLKAVTVRRMRENYIDASIFEHYVGDDAKQIKNGKEGQDDENKIEEDIKKDIIDSHAENNANEDSECEFIKCEKSEDMIVIEDNVNTNVIDDSNNKMKIDDTGNLNGAQIGGDYKAVTSENKGVTLETQSVTAGNTENTVDEHKATVINNLEKAEQEDLEVIDSDNIEEDDLEDF